MKKYLAAVAAVSALAGCGASASPTPATAHCTRGDYAMSCALKGLAPTTTRLLGPRLVTAPVAHGWDFGWSCPNPVGRDFGASYLSYDRAKNWTRACVNLYHSHGAATVAVWETTATRVLGGRAAGASDARAAIGEANALGMPAGRPIYFAIDFDEAPAQAAAVASYFRGVHDVFDNDGPVSFPHPRPVGAYGGYWPIKRLFDAGLIRYGWQTYAWSGGLWDPRAQLEQYLNQSQTDLDRAIARDYGQWPYTAPKPAPKPTPKPAPKPAPKPTPAPQPAPKPKPAPKPNPRACAALHQRAAWFASQLKHHPQVKAARRQRALAATRRAIKAQHC